MHVATLCAQLRALIGEDKVLTDSNELAARSHDFWLLDLQRRVHGGTHPLPLCVVQPETTADVSAVLSLANRERIPVVPFGAGSGVCGGAKPDENSIVMDMRKMTKVIKVNDNALTVTVQPGLLGSEFERLMNERGYSLGHFPQSIGLSTVGGWVATRASGQFSTKYGGIEDMLVCLKAVLADGSPVATSDVPRSSTGPNVNQLLLGSEGTLAVITELTFKIHPLPEKQAGSAFRFSDFHEGLGAIQAIMRAGWKPALVRLYDATETVRHFPEFGGAGASLLLVLSEGPAALVDAELSACRHICLMSGAPDVGDKPVNTWLENRFHVPDMVDLAENKGVIFDTIEVAANWDHIHDVYNGVISALRTVPGLLVGSAHSSHSYQQGTCLYFTFAVKKPYWMAGQIAQRISSLGRFNSPRHADVVARTYNECWQKVMEATLANHGTISHHHGIGKVRMPWVESELSLSYRVLERIKHALDPNGILNPGTLFKRK
jgi:alkyldihydroxyacetonephosphate synthase